MTHILTRLSINLLMCAATVAVVLVSCAVADAFVSGVLTGVLVGMGILAFAFMAGVAIGAVERAISW